jgi:hypothetical protein
MHIELRERDPMTRRWETILATAASLDEPVQEGPLKLNEASDIELTFRFEIGALPVRVLVSDVLVASSREQDRPDFFVYVNADDDGEHAVCRGRLLRDWVGLAELHIEALGPLGWQAVVQVMPLRIAAGKIAEEEFEALCEDVAAHSAAALLDVYG